MRSREFGDRLRSALTERGVQTIDLLEIFLADPDPWRFYYPDDGHFTAQGHAAVAEAIFKAVAAPQLLRATVTRDSGDSGG